MDIIMIVVGILGWVFGFNLLMDSSTIIHQIAACLIIINATILFSSGWIIQAIKNK